MPDGEGFRTRGEDCQSYAAREASASVRAVAGPGICLYWCGTSLYAAGQGFPANHKGRLKEGAIS